MIDDEKLVAVTEVFQRRIDKIMERYLELVGEHIRKIGRATASDISRLSQMRIMGSNIQEIEFELSRMLGINAREVRTLLREAARSTYSDSAYLYRQTDFNDNPVIQRVFAAQAAVTMDQLVNLSNTTLVSEAYRAAVDDAITAVQSGVTTYQDAVRGALREVASQGLRVRYPSGYERRLDTAVRQNVLDGVRAMTQSIADATGKEFGADGVEISAHIDCAEDHLDVQGEQYSNSEFEHLQGSLARPIGQLNCRHFYFPIIMGVSSRAVTAEQLRAMNAQSSEMITIDGKEKSRYHWTQEQRRIETAVRGQKDLANIARAAGDTKLQIEAQGNIAALRELYRKVSKEADLPTRYKRMEVAGYVPIRG